MVANTAIARRKTKATNRTRARTMRRKPVAAEKIFWSEVRDRRLGGYKFKRQYLVGNYIADFVCLERKLIIELDGAFHPERAAYDEKRDEFLRTRGFSVMRIRNEDLAGDISGFLVTILHMLESSPSPP